MYFPIMLLTKNTWSHCTYKEPNDVKSQFLLKIDLAGFTTRPDLCDRSLFKHNLCKYLFVVGQRTQTLFLDQFWFTVLKSNERTASVRLFLPRNIKFKPSIDFGLHLQGLGKCFAKMWFLYLLHWVKIKYLKLL